MIVCLKWEDIGLQNGGKCPKVHGDKPISFAVCRRCPYNMGTEWPPAQPLVSTVPMDPEVLKIIMKQTEAKGCCG